MNRFHSLLALPLLALAASGTALAQSATTDFEVRIDITSTCHFAADATDVDFGSVASTATDVTASGALSVLCTPGTDFSIALDAGQNGDAGQRGMASIGTGDTVPYELFQDASLQEPWGVGAGTNAYSGTGTGSAETVEVYGRVPSANFRAGDDYSDTVTATITY